MAVAAMNMWQGARDRDAGASGARALYNLSRNCTQKSGMTVVGDTTGEERGPGRR
jgi:hypothetical protein